MPKNVIIVGPPRSGTSLTAAVFARRGYYVGEIESTAIRDGDDNNPYGYFEADRLIERNVDLLRRAGFAFHNSWKYGPVADEVPQRLACMPPSQGEHDFVAHYASRQPWMWKDPRLCLTLPVWAKAVNPDNTAILVVHRAADEILRSFLRMGWCEDRGESRRQAETTIRLHADCAERFARESGIPSLSVDYARYLQDAAGVASEIGALCGLPLTAEDLNVRQELSHSSWRGRLSARLRRSLDRGALRPLRLLRPMIPRGVLTLAFPEKKYQGDGRG
jgi:hypothetical protein